VVAVAFTELLNQMIADAELEVRAFMRDYSADMWELLEEHPPNFTGLKGLIDSEHLSGLRWSVARSQRNRVPQDGRAG
jgi:hypothetical protein